MKILARLLLLAFTLAGAPAFAQTVSQYISEWTGSTPITSSGSITSAVAGQVEIAETTSTNGSSNPVSSDFQIYDSVDGIGNPFVACKFYYDSTNNIFIGVFIHVVLSGGTRTVTLNLTNTTYGSITAQYANGFTGTPTCDSTIALTNRCTSGCTTSFVLSPAVTTYNREIAVFVATNNTNYLATTPSGYSLINMTGALSSGFDIQSTAGANVAISGAYFSGSGGIWSGLLAGIYDSGAATAPPAAMFTVQ